MEMMNPLQFKEKNKEKDLNELLNIKKDLENSISRLEAEESQIIYSDTRLDTNKHYLEVINELINEKMNKKGEILGNEQTLDNFIKRLSGNDPFWEITLKHYFDSLNKTDDEKIRFLRKISYTKELFNEFTKEIVSSNNSEDLYNKYMNESKNILVCPNCGEKLSFMMPDGKTLNCDKCNKYYINNNGEVGNETSSPYIDNNVLY